MKTHNLILAFALSGLHTAAAQRPRVSIPRATTQVAAATVALPVGVFAGVGLGMLAPSDSANRQVTQILGGIVGGVTGVVIGPALAVRVVGTGGAPHGNGADAVAGTMAGYAADLILDGIVAQASRSHKNGVLTTTVFLANFVLPAVGATLAYDLSHR